MDKKKYDQLKAEWVRIKIEIKNSGTKTVNDILHICQLEEELEQLEYRIQIQWRKINDQI